MPPALRSAAWPVVALALSGVLLAVPLAAEEAPVTPLPSEVVYGIPTGDYPSVGLLTYRRMECTATVIGCRTVLTAAHCLCYDPSFDPPRLLLGDECREHGELADPSTKSFFLHHAGRFGIEEMIIHPGWDDRGRNDLAILRLDRPVTGVRPAAIDDLRPVPPGTDGTVVGFGRTRRDRTDQGIKRVGSVTTGACPSDLYCWWLFDPPGAGQSRAGLCFHDSGGPLFAELPEGPVLAGVHHSTGTLDCRPPSQNFSTEVYSRREWIAEVVGSDLFRLADLEAGAPACGEVPAAGEPGSRVRTATGHLSEERPDAGFFIQVPPGTGVLRFGLTATGRSDPADADFDLYVRHGAQPDPDDPARTPDCTSAGPSGIEFCEIREPEPGPWYAAVRRVHGEGRYQIVATQLDGVLLDEPDEPEEPPPPPAVAPEPPPELPWIDSPALPGFETKVRIGGSTPGTAVEDCVAETVCVAGALAGRPEVFLKVVGPRPNGHLWVQIARFTPARVEIWLHRRATGEVNHYVLDPVAPSAPDVSGLQDREAFAESL